MIQSTLFWAALANGVLIGLIPVLVDGIKPLLKTRLGIVDHRIEWFGRLFYLSWLPVMPLAGLLLDAWSTREVLLYCGLVPLILSVAWLAMIRDARLLWLNALLLGGAYSIVATAGIRAMTVAFFSPEYVADWKLNIASLNLGFVAVGVGAFVGPWLVLAIERWCGVRQGLHYLSIALLVPAVLTALWDARTNSAAVPNAATFEEMITRPHLAMIAVVLLIYFALENCLEYWPEAFLKEVGYEGRSFHTGIFIFWLAFIVSRGLAAWYFYEFPNQGFVMTLILLGISALVLGNLAGGFDIGSSSLGFWLLGACYGPLLPGILGIALDGRSDDTPLSNCGLGILLALSGFDTFLARPILDVITKGRSARTVMRVPTILALIAVALLLVLRLI